MAGIELARAFLGVGVFIGIAWLVSEQRRHFPWKQVLLALVGQFALAVLLTRTAAITAFFGALARGVDHIQSASVAGAGFVFGYLSGGPSPFVRAEPAVSTAIFVFQSLPAIVFVSALAALLWHWRVLRWFVRGSAWLFSKLFGVSAPVGVSTSACIILGMIEAPLLVRPILPQLTRGELFVIMVDGMSVLAGSMMMLLGAMLEHRLPGAFSHLLTAALISTPMAIGLARAIIPSDTVPADRPFDLHDPYRSSLDALAHGALIAVKMAANIVALLIVFVGLIALVNELLALLPHAAEPITLAKVFGHVLAPVAWLMGVPDADLRTVGALLGTKVTVNEIVAYGQLASLAPGSLSGKGMLIVTYALSSFGNIGSVAILIGTLSALAPDKADAITQMGFKALLASTLATCLTGTTVGILSSLLS